MSMESDTKETAITKLLDTWQVSLSTDGQYDAYLDAVEDCSADAVTRAVKQFCDGRVERATNAFVPKPPELAVVARQWDYAIATVAADRMLVENTRLVSYKIGEKPSPPLQPLGPIKMEIGGIMRDTSGWTFEQKEEAMRTGKLPESLPAPDAKTIQIPVRRMS